MIKILRLSYSQIKLWKSCKRNYFFRYISKIPEKDQETKYCDFGKAMHETLEEYYNNKNKDFQQNLIDKWKKYKLDNRMDFNSFKIHVFNGISLGLNPTDVEEKYFLRIGKYNIVGYLDIVDTEKGIILDWKSGTFNVQKMLDYKDQLKYYSYFYLRKNNKYPNKAILFFNKNSVKCEFEIVEEYKKGPDCELLKTEIDNVPKEIIEVGDEIMKFKENCKTYDKYEQNLSSCFFCGYKGLCLKNDKSFQYRIVIKNNYCFLEGHITPMLLEGIDRETRYDMKNKHWMQKAVLAKSRGGIKNIEEIGRVHLFNKNHRMFPIGFINKIRDVLIQYCDYNKVHLNLEITDLRDKEVMNNKISGLSDKLLSGIELRPYQIEAIESFIYNDGIGIWEMGTGSGKTVTATELIRQISTKTLWICDRKELLKQAKDCLEENLGIEVGQIGDGICDIKDVTVSTIQSLASDINKHKKLLNSINFVVVDEFHKSAAESYQKIAKELRNTKYRLGLSGTARRDDGNTPVIFSLFGNIIYSKKSDELIKQGYLMKPEIIFYDIDKVPVAGELYDEDYKEAIVNNTKRNDKIVNLATGFAKGNDKKVLILSKIIEHGELLKTLINDKYPDSCEFIHGSINKEEREKLFEDFKAGKLKILIGTISIFSEGIDVPDLDVIINACANKGEVKTIQSLGRVLRKADGKERAIYIDFFDNTSFFRKASLSRISSFKKENHLIVRKDYV